MLPLRSCLRRCLYWRFPREGYTGELCELMFCPGDVGYPPPSWTETEAAARPKFRTADPHRDACDVSLQQLCFLCLSQRFRDDSSLFYSAFRSLTNAVAIAGAWGVRPGGRHLLL